MARTKKTKEEIEQDSFMVRDEFNLIPEVTYIWKDGIIDWRKMIPEKYLYAKDKRNMDRSISELDDEDLAITLGGIKYVARLRGYRIIKPRIVVASSDFVSAECHITWIPNKETNMIEQSFGDAGDASKENTTGFGQLFLTSIAANRAFVRAVRNYLNINVVGQEELKSKYVDEKVPNEEMSQDMVYRALVRAAKKRNWKFEYVKDLLVAKKVKDAESYRTWEDIPIRHAFQLLNVSPS